MLRKIILIAAILTLAACSDQEEEDSYEEVMTVSPPIPRTEPSVDMDFRDHYLARNSQSRDSPCKYPNLERAGVCYLYDYGDPRNRLVDGRPDTKPFGPYSTEDMKNRERGCIIRVQGWYVIPGSTNQFARDWTCPTESSLGRTAPAAASNEDVDVTERYQEITCDPAPLGRETHARPANGWKPFAKALKPRTRQTVLLAYTSDSSGESRVPVKEMRAIASSITGLCLYTEEQFRDFFMSPDVEEIPCTPELLAGLNMGRTSADGQVVDYNYGRTACHPGEVLYRWNDIFFVSNTCLNPTPKKMGYIKHGTLGTPSPQTFLVDL